jgi:2-polyprenyl-6-methoxyphenol hydroxylase-like FAD-dependent oxidoreductase
MIDLIVSGGGPGGVMAAIAAGRSGLKTLLIERHGFLGGMNTAGLVGPIMTFHAGSLQIVRGVPGEIFDKLKEMGGTPGHLVDPIWGTTSMTPIDTEVYKALLLEEIAAAGVELLLHTSVLSGEKKGPVGAQNVVSLTLSSKKGLSQVSARYYIDATGDGDLAASLGCEFLMGRESDQLTQPMSLMFKMSGVDTEKVRAEIRRNPSNFYLGFPLEEFLALPGLAVSGFFEEVKRGKEGGVFPLDRDRVLFFGGVRPGEVIVNTLRINRVNGTLPEDLTRAESTLRKQVPVLSKFLRELIPGFENSHVTETAAQVGVRETRHILGDYVLRAEDVLEQRRFEDVIAHASYPIDIHSPDGSGMNIHDLRKEDPQSFYDIPYRCLLPRGIENLLVTGRCISAEHEASASSRISATCMALGQASGTAVALALKSKAPSLRAIEVKALQEQLLKDGAYLIF